MPRSPRNQSDVRTLRKALRLTQDQLAQKTELSRRTIQEIEAGKHIKIPEKLFNYLRDHCNVAIRYEGEGTDEDPRIPVGFEIPDNICEMVDNFRVDVRTIENQDLHILVDAITAISRLIFLAARNKSVYPRIFRELENQFRKLIAQENLVPAMQSALSEHFVRRRTSQLEEPKFSSTLAAVIPFYAGLSLAAEYESKEAGQSDLGRLQFALRLVMKTQELPHGVETSFKSALNECEQLLRQRNQP